MQPAYCPSHVGPPCLTIVQQGGLYIPTIVSSYAPAQAVCAIPDYRIAECVAYNLAMQRCWGYLPGHLCTQRQHIISVCQLADKWHPMVITTNAIFVLINCKLAQRNARIHLPTVLSGSFDVIHHFSQFLATGLRLEFKPDAGLFFQDFMHLHAIQGEFLAGQSWDFFRFRPPTVPQLPHY